MTIEEALARTKPFADKCIAGGISPIALGGWEAFSGDGTRWLVHYKEDWRHHYMKPSLNGKMRPIIFLNSDNGTRLILQFEDEKGKWVLVHATIMEADSASIEAIRKIREEWNDSLREDGKNV